MQPRPFRIETQAVQDRTPEPGPKRGQEGVSARLSGEEQVFQALVRLGGAAHVDEIVQQVTLARRRRGLNGGPAVRSLVETALHHMRARDDHAQAPCDGRVYRPFGAASRRWAVCRSAPAAPRRLALVD